MNGAITVGTRVLVILGYLVGAADSEAMDGAAVARVSLVLAAILLAAVLFYVVLGGPTVALWSRMRRRPWRRPLTSVKG